MPARRRQAVKTVTFDGLTLRAARGTVMTPRATSRALVAAACARIHGAANVADVGTGSGAIAIAIAVRRSDARVWATDIDERAVALARSNAVRAGVDGRVHVSRGDLLDGVPAPLDVIVANLPYLPERDAARYPELAVEPFGAVFAAGDGLSHYRRLIRQAGAKLAPGGTLFLQFYGEVIAAQRGGLGDLEEALAVAGGAAIAA
jgi:release factor glutamine methyltransferase